jgi:putative peptide zinc metalloprotease protein
MLPALRQDLSLHPGPQSEDGSPTWTLHDPAANRFYRLGWAAFEILARWPLGNPQAILAAVRRDTTLQPEDDDVKALLEFLARHHLIDAQGPADTKRLAIAHSATKLSRGKWLLKNYLFFRLPLFRPMPTLDRLASRVAWAYDKRFWIGVAMAAMLGLYFASRQWDAFLHTFAGYATLSGWLAIGIALSFAKVLHEFGHAFTAHRYGCRVPTMGIAFLVLWPVLYTDTNEAWKLPDKRQRLAIAAAGMLSELALAAAATLLWSFLPDGPLRAAVFLLATTTWIMTLAINASPFMRFDGYFLLSDWLDMPNLHGRSFALGRWWLREKLFGWRDPPPEYFPPRRQRFLIAFAFGTWLYRLALFLGIALLVYHVFFKVLGIFLLIVELAWFIGMPIMSELKVWWKRRHTPRDAFTTRRTVVVLLILLAAVLLPWQGSVRAPAVLGAAQEQGLYATGAARVLTAPPPAGTLVEAGQEIMQLESPDLSYRLRLAQNRERMLDWERVQQPLDTGFVPEGRALTERWEEAAAEVAGLREQIDQLVIRAPFAGRIAERAEGLQPGSWVSSRQKLIQLAGATGARGEAFVNESELRRLHDDAHAVFIADMPGSGSIECRVGVVDQMNLPAIDTLYVASSYGGAIPVQKDRDGTLVPTEAMFRVRLEDCEGESPSWQLRGVAHLDAGWSSPAADFVRRMIASVQKEMGF